MIKFVKPVGTTIASIILLVSIYGCNKGPAEQAGQNVDKAIDKAGQQVEKAGDKVQDAVQSNNK